MTKTKSEKIKAARWSIRMEKIFLSLLVLIGPCTFVAGVVCDVTTNVVIGMVGTVLMVVVGMGLVEDIVRQVRMEEAE